MVGLSTDSCLKLHLESMIFSEARGTSQVNLKKTWPF